MIEGEQRARDDIRWMWQCLALASLGEGTTSPNPRVGCLVVRDGQVVGRGFHRAPGTEHAEVVALDQAGQESHGSTLYVNLEPCCHQGRTPPCCDLILRAGIRRVVAATGDPNPQIDGKGFDRLRAAGLEVTVGVLEEQARSLNLPFLRAFSQGRPLVTLKAAISLDGMISALEGESRWITCRSSRKFAHRLRFSHDAVLVGANTVRQDDPRLTVRLPGIEAPNKLRVILAPRLSLDTGRRLFGGTESGIRPPRIYYHAGISREIADQYQGMADPVPVGGSPDRLDLLSVLEDLGRDGVQSVLVEGGARTLAGFLEDRLADRIFLFAAPKFIGTHGGTPVLDIDAVAEPELGWRLDGVKRFALGKDTLFFGNLHYPPARSVEEKKYVHRTD